MAAWVGQDTSTGAIYIEGKGVTTPRLVDAVRELYPVHSVPRADVCEDYSQPGAFHALRAVITASKGVKVKSYFERLPDDPTDGSTWAVGQRGGVAYLRLYEKGKQPEFRDQGRPDWVRAELECRPHYAKDKRAVASMQPAQVWGMSSWSHSVGQSLMQAEIARYEAPIRQYSYDKTTRYIATTFRRHLEEMLVNGEDIQRTFQAIWEDADASQAHRH